MLLSITAEEASKAFENAHPLGYGDSTELFTDRLARFLIRYAGRQLVNPRCLFPCGGVTDALNKLVTFLAKRSGFRPRAVAFVEDTTDLEKVNLLKDRGISVRTVLTDENGLVVEDLEQQLRSLHISMEVSYSAAVILPWPMLVYLSPTFSVPTGKTLPNARRMELLQLTSAYNVPVISDESQAFFDFTSELIVLRARDMCQDSGYATPSSLNITAAEPIVAMADLGFRHVFSISSFSQILAPGLRVGWIETSTEDDRYCLRVSAVESSGSCICYFTACVVAYLMEMCDNGSNESKLFVHICRLRESFALRYHTLTTSFFKNDRAFFLDNGEGGMGSGMFLPGYNCEYTDGTLPATFKEQAYQTAVSLQPLLPSALFGGRTSLAPVSTQPAATIVDQSLSFAQQCVLYGLPVPPSTVAMSVPTLASLSTSSIIAEPHITGVNIAPFVYGGFNATGRLPQPRRVGGLFLRVQLPSWLIELSSYMHIDKSSTLSGNGEEGASDQPLSKRQRLRKTDSSVSLSWFLDKARKEYGLDFRLDGDNCPVDDYMSMTYDYSKSGTKITKDDSCAFSEPGVSDKLSSCAKREIFLCFARLSTSALEDAGKLFLTLMLELFQKRNNMMRRQYDSYDHHAILSTSVER